MLSKTSFTAVKNNLDTGITSIINFTSSNLIVPKFIELHSPPTPPLVVHPVSSFCCYACMFLFVVVCVILYNGHLRPHCNFFVTAFAVKNDINNAPPYRLLCMCISPLKSPPSQTPSSIWLLHFFLIRPNLCPLGWEIRQNSAGIPDSRPFFGQKICRNLNFPIRTTVPVIFCLIRIRSCHLIFQYHPLEKNPTKRTSTRFSNSMRKARNRVDVLLVGSFCRKYCTYTNMQDELAATLSQQLYPKSWNYPPWTYITVQRLSKSLMQVAGGRVFVHCGGLPCLGHPNDTHQIIERWAEHRSWVTVAQWVGATINQMIVLVLEVAF